MDQIMNASRDSDDNNSEDEMLKLKAFHEQATRAVVALEAAVTAIKDLGEEDGTKPTEDTEAKIKSDKDVKLKPKKVAKKSKKGKMAEGSDEDVVPAAESMLETPSKSGKRKLDSGDEQTEAEDLGSAKKSKKAVATPKKQNTRGIARKVKTTPKKAVYDSE